NARVDTGRSEKATAATLQPLKPRIPVEVIRIIDGDTVEVRAHIWLDQHVTTKVRIRSIDAPERKARCPLEAQMAEISRDRLVTLMGTGPAFLTDLGQDKYGGRVLGSLLTSRGEDVGAILVASGHARTYSGGRRQGWC
ncbi:MAG: thermonuclease family protein, partial [Beijerinckiaceae bacterium]